MRLVASRATLVLAFYATQALAATSWSSGPLIECPFDSLETLEGCTSTLQWNTDEVCGERGSWLPYALFEWLGIRGGLDRITLDNLGRLNWWSGKSFADDALKFLGTPSTKTWEDFADWMAESWRSLTVYTLAGVVPFLIGLLVFLTLIFVVIPALLIGTCRRQKKEKPPKPPLSSRKILYYSLAHGAIALVVMVCIISMLHNVNSVYYSIAPARCVSAALSEDFLIGPLRPSPHLEYAGTSSALIGLQQAASTIQSLSDEVSQPISLKEKTILGLTSLFAPLLWTDALLRAPNHFIGWLDVSGSRTVPFSLNMTVFGASNLSDVIQFESSNGDYGAILQAAELTGTGSVETPKEVQTAVASAQRVVTDVQRIIKDSLPTFSDSYHYLKEAINRVTQWSDWNLRTAYWNLVLFSALPVLGIIMAILLNSTWRYQHDSRRAGRDIEPSRLAQLGSGYMIFGLGFWGGFLFLVGGGVLIASYFTSDACHFMENDLFRLGRYNSYPLFDPVPPQIFQACFTDTATGDLLEEYGNLTISDLSDYLSGIQVIDSSLLPQATIPHPAASNFVSKNGVSTLILPVDYQALPHTDQRIRWSSLYQHSVQSLPADALNALTAQIPTATLPIYGLSDVTEALNEYLQAAACTDSYLCLGKSCPAQAVSINMHSVYRYDLRELTNAINAEDWQSIATNMAASSRMRDILQCVARSSVLSASKKGEFFGGLWIASIKSAALSPLLRAPKVVSDASFIDLCPVAEACPLYHHIFISENAPIEIDLVTHETWERRAPLDIANALSLTNATRIAEVVASSAVNYNLGTVSGKSLESVNTHFNCLAIFEAVREVEESVCNGPASDIAAWGVATVIVAAMHVLGAALIWPYWKSQRQLSKRLPKMDDRENSLQEALPPPRAAVVTYTPEDFLYAAELGVLPRVEACLKQFPPNSVQDIYYYNTPLHLCCYYGHLDCARKILEASWFVDPLNFKGNTPLMAVVCNISMSTPHKLQICKLLLERGANPRSENTEHETPFSAAQKMPGHEELITLMRMYDQEMPQ